MEAQKFGARLKQLRKQAGMTQRELADKVGVDFTYLSKIESGAMPPPSEKIILQLAESLNADKDELTILAGKIPPDIAQILMNRETLQHLRSAHARQMARASKKRGGTIDTMKRLMSHNKRLSKIAIPIALVLAVAASLWFASPFPARALTINFPTPPSSGIFGTTHTFRVEIDIANTELLPIQSIDLYIYKSDARTTYEATCANLPLDTLVTPPYTTITATGTSGTCGTVSITASTTNWEWFSGIGYAYWAPTGGYTFPTGYGYGYSGTGTASIIYTVNWISPTDWLAGQYLVEIKLTANTTTFTETSSEFTLSGAAAAVEPGAGGRPPAAAPGATDVSDVVTSEGEFTEAVTAESEDGKVELTIDEGTIGLIEEEPLSEISITEMEEPPAPPADSSVIGLVYDLGPDEATFDPPITLTFTYDPALIPEGVAEENLVIAIWDEAAGEWVNLVSTVDPVTNTITARVSHFTTFTVIAYTRPAVFTATDLAIAPEEVGIGETVTVSALVTNTGDLAGKYKVTLKIDGVVVATKDVTLAGGASQKVTFTTAKDVAGTYAVIVGPLSGTFVVKAPPAPPVPPKPAAFTASALSISPTEVDIGQSVTISVLVANTGDLSGSYKATLKIDNVVVATKDVTLAGGASQKVTFTTTKNVAGTYAVIVDGQRGEFTVVKPVPPPFPWWWIVVGVVVVGLLVYFLIVRRRRA